MEGDSVITPAELASDVGYAEVIEWPMLASHWLVDGYDSDELRWLASLNRAEAQALTVTDMRDVLRSIEIEIAIAPEVELQERCARALAVVQRDLDSTGFDEFRMHPRVPAQGSDTVRPSYVVSFANGDYAFNAEPLFPDVGDDELLADAANAVSDTIIDVVLISWPECIEHFGPPLSARAGRTNRCDQVHWYCSQGDHPVAEIGQLSTRVATVRGQPARPWST